MTAREQFSGRWGLLAAALGMAIGTGNIWRIPRVAAANGGGAFGALLGLPSALSHAFFTNQDGAWGLGLAVSGVLFATAVILYGPERFRRDCVDLPGNDLLAATCDGGACDGDATPAE